MDVFDLIKRHEGYSRAVYRCTAGRQTIGHGRNLDDVGISREEADYLLRQDVERALKNLRDELYWPTLDEVRRAACIDLVFNIGWIGFTGFKRFRAAMLAGAYNTAADELVDSQWYKQVRTRGPRIVHMIRLGEWPSD